MAPESDLIGPVGSYAPADLPKRDRHSFEDQPEYCSSPDKSDGLHPGHYWSYSIGIDRFGADCIRWLAVRRKFDGSLGSFKKIVKTCDERMQQKAPFEGLRMVLPFVVPVIFYYLAIYLLGSYYQQRSFGGFNIMISEDLTWGNLGYWWYAVIAGSLLVGQFLHRNISKAIAHTIPAEAILITTYMTRHNLTMADLEKKPGLLEGAIHASTWISYSMQEQMKRMVQRSIVWSSKRKVQSFLMPAQNNHSYAPAWQDLVDIYNAYITYFPHKNLPAAFGAAGVAGYSMPYQYGVDDMGLPQVNTNGMPMLANTGIDVTGHSYGSPENF